MRFRKWMALLTAVLVCGMLAACGSKTPQAEPETETTETVTDTVENTQPPTEAPDVWGRTVRRNGHTWRYNSRQTTVLFMGVDTKAEIEETALVGNGGRSDTMALLVLDPESQTTRVVAISRDTMTRVGVYNRRGEKLYDGTMQITMQYAFGDSPAKSCQLSKKAVSAMLLDLPIDSYCSLTLDGVTAAVNLMGGITLTLEDDWTDIDPSYLAGETITMDAPMVERFLRYRDTGMTGSNDVRMERQGWFVHQLFKQISAKGSIGVKLLLEYVDPYLETDMDGDTIKHLADYQLAEVIYKIPGQTLEGKKHDEYYIDEEAMKDLLLELFYNQVD